MNDRWRAVWARLRNVHLGVRFAVAVVVLPIAGLATMVASDLVPDRWVMEEMVTAVRTGALTETDHSTGYRGGIVDHFSECKRMTVGLGDPPGVGTVESAIRSPTLGRCSTTVPAVRGWLAGDGLRREFDYIRYWNGSASLLRPGIATVGLSGTRVLLAMGLVGFGTLAWRQTRSLLGPHAAALGAFVLVATTDFIDLPGALVHAVAWCCILLTVAVILRLSSSASVGELAWVAFLLGAIFLFFGDMANPEAAWTAAIGAAGLGALHTNQVRPVTVRMACVGVAWIAGFAWMWVSKWIIAALVVGTESIRANVTDSIGFRLDGSIDGVNPTVGAALARVWDAWWGLPLTPIFVIAAVLVGLVRISRIGRSAVTETWRLRLVVGLIPVIPIVWYAVLRNHTYIHNSFVYRSLALGVALSLMAWTANIPTSGSVRSRGR